MRLGLAALIVGLAVGLARSPQARADEPARSAGDAPESEAEVLFQQGRALLTKDDWRASCALFDASAKLSEVPAALVKVARCRAHEGRLSKAIEVYERALALAPWPELDRLVRAELFAIERRAPSIRITFVEPATGVTVRRNGRLLAPAALRSPLFTDVGVDEHVLAEAIGFRSVSFDLKAKAEAEVLDVRVTLQPDAAPPSPLRPPPTRDVRGPAGWATTGAAALALGFGAGFGAEYLEMRGNLFDACTGSLHNGTHVCPATTSAQYDDTIAARTRAIALLGTGAGLLAIGVALVVTAPKRTGASPRLSLSAHAGADLRVIDVGGTW